MKPEEIKCMLAVGVISLAVGTGSVFGFGQGLAVLGAACIVIGCAIGFGQWLAEND